MILGTPKVNQSISYDGLKTSYTDNFSGAWFGGTIETQDSKTGKILICGHRWLNEPWWFSYSLMNGACFLSNHNFELDKEFDEKLIPLSHKKRQQAPHSWFWYMYGSLGFSAHFTGGERNEILLGAPGVHQWTGSVIRYRESVSTDQINSADNLYVYDPSQEPPHSRVLNIYDYFGYAVSSGKFYHDQINYVASAPRANSKGKVFVFDLRQSETAGLEIRHELEGTDIGEYFGAALAVVDLNNDGLDDLLVGAPTHTLKNKARGGDHGKVYVFMNDKTGKLSNKEYTIAGSNTVFGRFGSSICVLGDINNDQFPDVAIGAPYENGNVGAVYIYHGGSNGLVPRTAQRIGGEFFNGLVPLKGFGISLSADDVDKNDYSDLLIGSYLSGHAILLRSSPVVKFNRRLISKPSLIRPDKGTDFSVEACAKYTAKKDPDNLCVAITLSFDIKYAKSRIILRLFNGTEVRGPHTYLEVLQRSEEKCRKFDFTVSEDRDFYTPIMMKLETQIRNSVNLDPSDPDYCAPLEKKPSGTYGIVIKPFRTGTTPTSLPQFCSSCPVIDVATTNVTELEIPFVSDCGSDNRCQADLKVSALITGVSMTSGYILGSSKNLTVNISVSNTGESAFLPSLTIHWDKIVSKQQLPSNCYDQTSLVKRESEDTHNAKRETDRDDFNRVVCELPGPLKKGDKPTVVSIKLDTTQIPSGTETFRIGTRVESKSEESEELLADNTEILELPLVTSVDLAIYGESKDQYQFNRLESNIARFKKTFRVNQRKESPIDLVEIKIQVPVNITNKESLVSLVDLFDAVASVDDQRFKCGSDFFVADPSEVVDGEEDTRRRRSVDSESSYGKDFIELERATESLKTTTEFNLLGNFESKSTKKPPKNRRVPADEKPSFNGTTAEGDRQRVFDLNCSSAGTQCVTVVCRAGPMDQSSEMLIILNGALKAGNIGSLLGDRQELTITASAKVKLISPDNGKISVDGRKDEVIVVTQFTDVTPIVIEASVYVYLGAAFAGVVLLLIIAYILYKLGFFKRKKHPTYSAVMQNQDLDD